MMPQGSALAGLLAEASRQGGPLLAEGYRQGRRPQEGKPEGEGLRQVAGPVQSA